MADNSTNESVIFEIKIDAEQYKAEQKQTRDSLGQVALDIEKTRAAQKKLNDERKAGKAGKVGDADYAQQSVKLREELRGQLANQRAQFKLQNDLIDLQLRKVQAGSDEELNLLQHKLQNERAIELAQKNVTAGQKRLIDLKYQADSTALLVSFQRQTALATLQAEQERNSACVAANKQAQAEQVAQGLAATQAQLHDEYQLQSRAAVLERELALASLDQRKNNAAAELRIRATANQKLADLNATQANAERQRRAKELSDEAH